MSNNSPHSVGPDAQRLLADLQRVVADSEALLRSTAGVAQEGAAELRARVQASLDQARAGLVEASGEALQKARAAGDTANDYVHRNPWQAVGVAAAVGLVVGLLVSKR